MPTPPTGTAPAPRNATTKERGVIDRLYRAADVTTDPDARPAMSEALALLVELIEGRNRRQDFNEHFDRPHDDD